MKDNNEHKYDDIIHLPHHQSKKRPHMSPLNRAAQFSPFAALPGHKDILQENACRTDSYVKTDESSKKQFSP